jgi:tetratricopeptide (TPR) repeat protein
MNNREKVLLHRGIDKVRQEKFEEALKLFDRVLQQNPEIVEAWNNRGVALYGLGRLEEALQSYNRSLEKDPYNLDALRNKGFLLRGLRRLEDALEVYDLVLQKGGDGYDLESTAAVLTALGRLVEALNCLYLAREKMPLDRLEDEIAMVKELMDKRGIPIPERAGPQANSPINETPQGEE